MTEDWLQFMLRRGEELAQAGRLSCWRQAHREGPPKGRRRQRKGRSCARGGGDLAPVIAELQASGATSLRAIASALNDRGIPTARGNKWFAASVRDVLARI